MGACNIDFEIKGKASRSEIEKRLMTINQRMTIA